MFYLHFLQDAHDCIILPGLKIQDFFDVILVFTELSMTDRQEIPGSRWALLLSIKKLFVPTIFKNLSEQK